MINEHEYFSAFSRDNRVFQSPEASRQTEYTLADKLSSHHIQPLHPLQCRGRAISASTEAQWFPSTELTHSLPQLYGILPAWGAGDWHWEPTLGSSPSPKFRHVLVALGGFCCTVNKEIIRGGPCMFAYNLQITVYFNLLANLPLHYISWGYFILTGNDLMRSCTINLSDQIQILEHSRKICFGWLVSFCIPELIRTVHNKT